ncbi:hypothetical protein AMECASPLE_013871 [Ameca splendens]|uniref:Uncharacterized protein n=1 Tax=Ameca splendens TaxID=208324 RepID=A0ABV0XEK4_9TELE
MTRSLILSRKPINKTVSLPVCSYSDFPLLYLLTEDPTRKGHSRASIKTRVTMGLMVASLINALLGHLVSLGGLSCVCVYFTMICWLRLRETKIRPDCEKPQLSHPLTRKECTL